MYNDSVVTTGFGPVRGWIRDGIHTFKGIRYGADTSAYRFLPPRDPAPWDDVANAFAFGPTCPQDHPDTGIDRADNPFLRKIGLTDNLPESEDCLFTNVWTPGTSGRRPVMVWVHSGAFSSNSGSSPSIDGTRLAKRGDVVVVTFNHRLNVLGYTQLTDDPSSPFAQSCNVGMLDIVALLRWVRANIAAFGGDPDNVTLFGQSGGATKISALLRMPAADGLFHRAVLQSGATPAARPMADALATAEHLARELGLDTIDADALQRVDLKDLMRAHARVAEQEPDMAFGAVDDGHVIVESAVSAGRPVVPVIIGDLDTEATLFMWFSLPGIAEVGWSDVTTRVASQLGDQAAARIVEVTRTEHPGATPYEVLARLISAGIFTTDAGLLADQLARDGRPVWRYRITWRTPVDDGLMLSPHELDVALTFGNVEVARGLNGEAPEAYALSEHLMSCWLSFARSGDPAAESDIDWPRYEEPTRTTLVLAPEPSLASDIDRAERDAVAAGRRPGVDWFAMMGP